ncbi:MAG: c-type cytochrome [Parvibaculum sp.]|nr:c-type cytochrome [Parvibaculum sp.]|tara:strand:+ start:1276 stop:1668 length:393 start_codon:yes stop_codon:yes gene_type:complete
MSGRTGFSVRFLPVLALAGTLTLLGGCGDNAGPPAAKAAPLDARLTEIYSRTCVGCHTTPDSGAPQSHNVAAWAPRMAQSDELLLAHMADGFAGMPPLGQCAECSAEDLIALMHFMAAPAPADPSTKDAE